MLVTMKEQENKGDIGKRFFPLKEQFPRMLCKNLRVIKGRAIESTVTGCAPSSLWFWGLLVDGNPRSLTWCILRNSRRRPDPAGARQFT